MENNNSDGDRRQRGRRQLKSNTTLFKSKDGYLSILNPKPSQTRAITSAKNDEHLYTIVLTNGGCSHLKSNTNNLNERGTATALHCSARLVCI